MQQRFKKHQKVKLTMDPLPEDVEPYKDPPVPVKKGMTGEINMLLQNGQYHVKITDEKGEEIAYVAIDEEGLEPLGEEIPQDDSEEQAAQSDDEEDTEYMEDE